MKAIVVTDQAVGTAGMKLVERPEPPAAINLRQTERAESFRTSGDTYRWCPRQDSILCTGP